MNATFTNKGNFPSVYGKYENIVDLLTMGCHFKAANIDDKKKKILIDKFIDSIEWKKKFSIGKGAFTIKELKEDIENHIEAEIKGKMLNMTAHH